MPFLRIFAIVTALHLAAAAAYATGAYVPPDMYGEYFHPYFFLGGPVVNFVTVGLSTFIAGNSPIPMSNSVAIVYLPGVISSILATMQYSAIYSLFTRRPNPRVDYTPVPVPQSNDVVREPPRRPEG